MHKNTFAFLSVLSLLLLTRAVVGAETLELVTYYPTTSNNGISHFTSLTVGTAYQGTGLTNGQALIETSLGIGPSFANGAGSRLTVIGTNDGMNSVTFFPGQDTAVAGTPELRFGIGTLGPIGVMDVHGAAGLADTVTFVPGTGGSLRVGIGTTNPAASSIFHAVGVNDALSYALFTSGADTNAAGTPQIRVGIGTAAPSQMLDVAGNIRMSGTRSVLLTQGDNNTTHVGGVQFLTPNNGTTLIMTPTDAAGAAVNNSTVTLGGFGNFNTNTVGLGVSGNLGVGRVYGPPSAAPNAQTNGNIDANDVYIRSANNGTGRWASQLGGSFFWLTTLPRVLDVAWNQSSPSDSTAVTGFVGAGAYTVYRTNWAAIDLNTYITQANMGTPRAAIVTARVWHHTNGHGGPWGPEVGSELKLVTSTTGVPTDNADVRMVRALDIADDSVIIASDSAEFVIPLNNNRFIYWSRTSVRQNGQNYDANAQVNLEGFLY